MLLLLHPLEIGNPPQPKGRRRPLCRSFAERMVDIIGGIPVCIINTSSTHPLLPSLQLCGCRRRHVLAVVAVPIASSTIGTTGTIVTDKDAIHEISIQVGGLAPLVHAKPDGEVDLALAEEHAQVDDGPEQHELGSVGQAGADGGYGSAAGGVVFVIVIVCVAAVIGRSAAIFVVIVVVVIVVVGAVSPPSSSPSLPLLLLFLTDRCRRGRRCCSSPLGRGGALGQRLERTKGPERRDGTVVTRVPSRRIGGARLSSMGRGVTTTTACTSDATSAVEEGPVRRLLGKYGLERVFVVGIAAGSHRDIDTATATAAAAAAATIIIITTRSSSITNRSRHLHLLHGPVRTDAAIAAATATRSAAVTRSTGSAGAVPSPPRLGGRRHGGQIGQIGQAVQFQAVVVGRRSGKSRGGGCFCFC